MKKNRLVFAFLSMLILIFGPGSIGLARAATWYFDPSGSDLNSGTSGSPWLNPGSHNGSYSPGDVLMVAAGTYTPTYGWGLTASGSATGGYITLQCAPNQTSKVVVTTNYQNGILFTAGASYWDLRGCDVTATGTNATAITVSGQFSAPFGPLHHIIIEGNYAHDSSCEGIGVAGNGNVQNDINGHLVAAYATDYIVIRNNNTYNNARTSGYHCSGISIYEPIAYDTNAGYHFIVQGNVSYGNFDCDSCGSPSDGNGIILDDFLMSQNVPLSSYAYAQATLVSDNVAYNNGGRGIHVFESQNVLINSNTAWGNNQDPNVCGSAYEIDAFYSMNITVTNNEAQAFNATNCTGSLIHAFAEYGNGTATGDVFDYNIGFSVAATTYYVNNSPGFAFGTHNQ